MHRLTKRDVRYFDGLLSGSYWGSKIAVGAVHESLFRDRSNLISASVRSSKNHNERYSLLLYSTKVESWIQPFDKWTY